MTAIERAAFRLYRLSRDGEGNPIRTFVGEYPTEYLARLAAGKGTNGRYAIDELRVWGEPGRIVREQHVATTYEYVSHRQPIGTPAIRERDTDEVMARFEDLPGEPMHGDLGGRYR